MRDYQFLILLGVPGLLIGATLGGLVRSWRIVVGLIALGAVGLLLGFKYFPEGTADDDDPIVLLAIAMVTNFGGWVVGLTAGAATVRVLRRRKA